MLENVDLAVKDLKKQLEKLYGRQLQQVILYGSWARRTAGPQSDVDVTVVLDGEVLPGREIDRMAEVLTDIQLTHNLLIAVYPVSAASFAAGQGPLLKNIHREGIAV